MKVSKKKRKYFDFMLHTEDNVQRGVCFSPEKHELMHSIENSSSGCVLKKVKFSNNDILVTDYSSVKKADLKFNKSKVDCQINSVTTILSESGLYDRVNIKAIVANLTAIEPVCHNNADLNYQKAIVYDNTGSIPITLYGDLTNTVKEGSCYTITNLVVHKFKSTRLVKATDRTVITFSEDNEIKFNAEMLLNEARKDYVGKATSIDNKSFNTKTLCSNCREEVIIDDNDIVECEKCEHIMSVEDCSSSRILSFVFRDDTLKQKIQCNASFDIIEKFYGSTSSKMKLAKVMLTTPAKITWDIDEEKVVSICKPDIDDPDKENEVLSEKMIQTDYTFSILVKHFLIHLKFF